MTYYQKRKEAVRELAAECQYDFNNHNYSYDEIYEFQELFTKLGRCYGLLKEFKENAII